MSFRHSVPVRRGSVTERRDVLAMSARQCVQILIETKIWTQTFFALPKVRKGREVFRNDKDSERNLSGLCGEVAE